MKRILTSLLLCAATALSCVAHPVNTNRLNVVYTNTPSEWNDFNWMWSGASDQALEIDFYGQQPSNLFLRLSKPDGSLYLTTQAGSLSDFGTNYRRWSVSIAKSNLPPSNVYRTEILSSSDSTTNIQDAVTLVMAKGRTRVQWSSFDGAPSTNNVWIYGDGWFAEHDLYALSQLVLLSNYVEAIRSGLINSNTYLIGYIDSIWAAATNRMHTIETSRYTKAEADARFLTNGSIVAESDPIWTNEKSLYATTNLLHLLALKHADATNKLQIVFAWGDHSTNGYIKSALTNDYLFNGAQSAQFINTNRPGVGIPYVRVYKPSVYYPVIELYEGAGNTTSRFGIYNGRLSEVEADGGGGVPYWNDNSNGLGSVNASIASISTNLAAATNNMLTKVQAASTYATGTPLYVESDPLSLKLGGGTITGALHVAGDLILTAVSKLLRVGGVSIQERKDDDYSVTIYNDSVNTTAWLVANSSGGFNRANSSNDVGVVMWDGNTLPDPRNLAAGSNVPPDWVNQSLEQISNSVISLAAASSNAVVKSPASGGMQIISNSAGLIVYGTNPPSPYAYAGLISYYIGTNLVTGVAVGKSGTSFGILGSATDGELGPLARWGNGVWHTILDTGLFSPESYTLYSEFTTFNSNVIKLVSGTVTQNQIGASTYKELRQNGTNLQLSVGGTNWLKIEGRLNVF